MPVLRDERVCTRVLGDPITPPSPAAHALCRVSPKHRLPRHGTRANPTRAESPRRRPTHRGRKVGPPGWPAAPALVAASGGLVGRDHALGGPLRCGTALPPDAVAAGRGCRRPCLSVSAGQPRDVHGHLARLDAGPIPAGADPGSRPAARTPPSRSTGTAGDSWAVATATSRPLS